MKVLAIDFDGVISDSALKSLFVSHNVYCRHFGLNTKKNFGGELFTFDNWEQMKNHYSHEMEEYRKLRSFIEFSSDFFVLIKIIEDQIEIQSQEDFIRVRSQMSFDYHLFRDLFFQEKEQWQQKDFKKWFSLAPFYEDVVDGIKRFLAEGTKIVIATSNLGKVIHPAFHPDYLGFHMDINDIFDRNYGNKKTDHMKAIADQYHARFSDIYFIDDQLSYLEETQLLGVNGFMAGWGYCTAEQKKIAQDKGITIIPEEKDFYPVLKKAFG